MGKFYYYTSKLYFLSLHYTAYMFIFSQIVTNIFYEYKDILNKFFNFVPKHKTPLPSSAEKKKFGFICLPQSQNNCVGFLNTVLQYGGLAGRWNVAGTVYMCCINCLYLAPPHTSLLRWRESYIYWVQKKNSSVLSVVVAWFCDALVLTSSSSSASTMPSPFFIIPWEIVS